MAKMACRDDQPDGDPTHSANDRYAVRTIEDLLTLLGGGSFKRQILDGNTKLRQDILEHLDTHGSKGATGTMTIALQYTVTQNRDVALAGQVSFKGPKAPAATATAYVDDQGQLTLYSPLMKQMHPAPRDVTTNYDPDTGEVRDPSGPNDIRDV